MEGEGRATQGKGTTSAKALSQFLCLRPSDSHIQGLSPSFRVPLFKLLWGTHFAIFNGYTHIRCSK